MSSSCSSWPNADTINVALSLLIKDQWSQTKHVIITPIDSDCQIVSLATNASLSCRLTEAHSQSRVPQPRLNDASHKQLPRLVRAQGSLVLSAVCLGYGLTARASVRLKAAISAF